MIIDNTNIEDTLKSLLQKKLTFEVDCKSFKTGRLLLFTQKYFYLSLILSTIKKKQEKLEIPIPFNIEVHKDDNLIYFDYRLATLAHNNKEALELLQKIPAAKNKFFDKILTINIIND